MLVSIAFPFFLPYLGVFHFFIHSSSSTIGFHQCFCFYDRRICTHSVDPSLTHFLCESLFYASQSALEFSPIHCPNGRLGQDLGFGGFAFALKLPELLNT